MLIKKIFFYLIILSILFSCKNANKNINVLTDDILIYDLSKIYNLRNPQKKIDINFQINKETNILTFPNSYSNKKYDIIIGGNLKDPELNLNNFYSVKKYIEEKESSEYINLFNDFTKKNLYKVIPYGLSFYVVIINKNRVNKSSFDFIGLNELFSTMQKYNINSNDYIKLSFTPYLATPKGIDWFFIFNSELFIDKNKISFESTQSRDASDFLWNYEEKYNFGNEKTKEYIDRYKEISSDLYLKNNVILFDIVPISKAFCYDNRLYDILLIKDLNYSEVNQKVISIQKNAKNKNDCLSFVDFILSEEIQEMMYVYSKEKIFYFNNIYLPIYNKIIKKNSNFNDDFYTYINRLKAVNFYNQNIRKKFISSFNYSQEMLEKGNITEKDFLSFLDKQLK